MFKRRRFECRLLLCDTGWCLYIEFNGRPGTHECCLIQDNSWAMVDNGSFHQLRYLSACGPALCVRVYRNSRKVKHEAFPCVPDGIVCISVCGRSRMYGQKWQQVAWQKSSTVSLLKLLVSGIQSTNWYYRLLVSCKYKHANESAKFMWIMLYCGTRYKLMCSIYMIAVWYLVKDFLFFFFFFWVIINYSSN